MGNRECGGADREGRGEMSLITEEELTELAIRHVCPTTNKATTLYERGAVKDLVVFGHTILKCLDGKEEKIRDDFLKPLPAEILARRQVRKKKPPDFSRGL